jgi:hypothetical protein
VRCTSTVKSAIEITDATIVTMATKLMLEPPNCRLGPLTIVGMAFAPAPIMKSSCTKFSRKNETPIAVISSESRGDLRSGA